MSDAPRIGDSFDLNRAFGDGFLAIRVAAAPLWLGGLLASISDGCGGGWPGRLSGLPKLPDRNQLLAAQSDQVARQLLELLERGPGLRWVIGMVLAFALIALLIGLLLFAFHCWLATGFIRLQVNVLEHASDDVGPLFSGKDRFWSMLGFKLVAGLATTAAAIVAAWPGAACAIAGAVTHRPALVIGGVGLALGLALPAIVYVALGVYLGELAVALEGASPMHALRRSFALARGHRLQLFGFALVCALVRLASLGGFFLCCIGVLATVPLGRALTEFAKTESFLLFTRGHEHTSGWALWRRRLVQQGIEPEAPVQGWGEAPGQPPREPPDVPS